MSKERIIKAFIKKWLLILIFTSVSTSISLYIAITSKPIYQSTTTLYIVATSNSQKPVITNDSIAVSQQLLKDYSELIKSDKFTLAVAEKIGDDEITNEELSDGVNIDVEKGANVFSLSYKDENPERAKVIDSAFSDVLIENMVGVGSQVSLNVVDEAKVPTNPLPTHKSINVILSFFISLISICMLIILLEYIDNTAHTVEDIEKELGFNVIGIIPEMDIK